MANISASQMSDLLDNINSGLNDQQKILPGFGSIEDIKSTANPGDILQIHRGIFYHYTLYIGDGFVINIDSEGKEFKCTTVSKLALEDVCKNSPVRVNNQDDEAEREYNASPKPVDEIIANATEALKIGVVPYELLDRNCEYYCTLWRFGMGFSTQVTKPTSTPLLHVVDAGMRSASDGWRLLFDVFKVTFGAVKSEKYRNRDVRLEAVHPGPSRTIHSKQKGPKRLQHKAILPKGPAKKDN